MSYVDAINSLNFVWLKSYWGMIKSVLSHTLIHIDDFKLFLVHIYVDIKRNTISFDLTIHYFLFISRPISNNAFIQNNDYTLFNFIKQIATST